MNYLLFYGPDTYSSRQKINILAKKYTDANLGDTNLSKLEASQNNIDQISRQIFAMPFLASKRLVILENFLLESKTEDHKQMLEIIYKIPTSTLLVFWEKGIPDRRSGLFKKLNQKGKSQFFDILLEQKLEKWIDVYLGSTNTTIMPIARQKLSTIIGSDLWRMSNELDKLVQASKNNIIDLKLVENMVTGDEDVKIFDLIDSLFVPSRDCVKNAIKTYLKFEKTGEYPLVALSLISTTLSRTMMVKSWMEDGLSISEINTKLKIHPFALKKITDFYIKMDWIQAIIRQRLIINIDAKTKSGKLDTEQAIIYLIARWNDID